MKPTTCFTYGSLMWPDIMARVCGREVSALQHTPAWLQGHIRHPVRGQDYPGLVPQPGAPALQGVLYLGLTLEDLQRLDAFEGPEYERVPVHVALESGAATDALDSAGAGPTALHKTWVYRYRPEFGDRLEPGDWSAQAFEAQGKARFCARYVGFAQTPAP